MCIKPGRSRFLTTGSLNARGSRGKVKQTQIADDMQKYKVAILGIQETHMKGTGVIDITTSDKKERYEFYYTGPFDNTNHGVGIVTRKDLQAEYKSITERSCMATIKLEKEKRNLSFISTYAHTLVVSEKEPNKREEYYRSLDNTVKSINKRNMLIIAGDMNAKTGTAYMHYPEVIGRYGKGEVNSNGKHLVEFALQNELFLTNTNFKHQMSHRTTWTGPERHETFKDKDGTTRRNPYRNQIDYIMIRKRDLHFVKNSRAYGGINVNTDHKMVKAELKIEWFKVKKKQQEIGLNIQNLKFKEYQVKYRNRVEEKIIAEGDKAEHQHPQQKWKLITKICTESAEEILGQKENKRTAVIKK